MNQALVSVALATYNGEKYLKEQLNSILWQTYPDIEIIITDDCSTDKTPEILREYAGKYPNIHVYYNEKNVGMTKNFESTLRHCRGDFIAFADQDDIWLPEKIQYLVDNINDSSFVYHDSAYIDSKGNLMNKKVSDFRKLITTNDPFVCDNDSGLFICGHAALFRRELLSRALPLNPYLAHDGWMTYVAILENGIKSLPDVKVHYRQHAGNVFGGLGTKVKRIKYKIENDAVERINALLSMLSENRSEREIEFRQYLEKMKIYYSSPTFINRLKRTALRFKYIKRVHISRKRNMLRKIFKIFKIF